MIRALLAFAALAAAAVLVLSDEQRLVAPLIAIGAVLAAWSAVRPTYRDGGRR